MADNGWVALDKRLVRTMSTINRPYSVVEAMFSFSVDKNCGKEFTERGYATLWGWSRNKVRSFIKNIQTTTGHMVDRKGTSSGPVVSFVDLRLQDVVDHNGANDGPQVDHKRDHTIKNKNKEQEKEEKNPRFRASEFLLNAGAEKQLVTDWLKVRKEKRLANTQTAFSGFLKEVVGSGGSINEVLTLCCQKGWGGFKVSWLEKEGVSFQSKKEEDKKCAGCGILVEFGCTGKTAESRACARYEQQS